MLVCEDQGEGFVEEEDEAVDEAVVEGGGGGDGFGEEEADWTGKRDFEEVGECCGRGFLEGGGDMRGEEGELGAETMGFGADDGGVAGFGKGSLVKLLVTCVYTYIPGILRYAR